MSGGQPGGHKGTQHSRGVCPVCQRVVSGGVWGTGSGFRTGKVQLRRHGPRLGCPGGKRTVERV